MIDAVLLLYGVYNGLLPSASQYCSFLILSRIRWQSPSCSKWIEHL